MPDVSGLSAAFVESHPADAARVLEGLPTADTAGFIAMVSPRLAAPILRHVGAPYCARVFEMLDDARVAALSHVMGPQAAARVLQQMSAARQLRVLAELPVATSITIRLLIGYPKGTCGALMDPWPLSLDADMLAAEALEQLRRFEGELGDCVFVTNGQRRLVGLMTLAELVRAAPRAPLSAFMRAPDCAVPALVSAALTEGHPAWDTFHVLPVVERENRLVGALHRHALAAEFAAAPSAAEPALTGGLFGVYWQMLTALLVVVIGTLPPVVQVASERSKDGR